MKNGWQKIRAGVSLWGRKSVAKASGFFGGGIRLSRQYLKALHLKMVWPKKMPTVHIDSRRRAFLKYAVFGGGLFLVGKYMNPLINTIQGDAVVDEKVFRNFTLTETGRQLQVTDDEGNEILTIDKEGF